MRRRAVVSSVDPPKSRREPLIQEVTVCTKWFSCISGGLLVGMTVLLLLIWTLESQGKPMARSRF